MGDLDSMVPLAHPSQSPKPQLDRFNHCRAYGRNPQTHRQTTERQKTPVARPHLQCESKILPPPYLQAMLRQQLKIYKKIDACCWFISAQITKFYSIISDYVCDKVMPYEARSSSNFLHFTTNAKNSDISATVWPVSTKFGTMTRNLSLKCTGR